eukprot:gene17758-biopygen8354
MVCTCGALGRVLDSGREYTAGRALGMAVGRQWRGTGQPGNGRHWAGRACSGQDPGWSLKNTFFFNVADFSFPQRCGIRYGEKMSQSGRSIPRGT